MTDFTIGQNIIHPEYGACTITFVGGDYVGIELGDGQQGLVKKESFVETPGLQEQDAPGEARPSSWPESTFVQEGLEIQHYPASHWDAFYDDPQVIAKKLQEIIKKAELWIGGVSWEAPHSLPETWPQGAILVWPNHRQGIMAVLRIGNPNSIQALYPFITNGVQHTLTITQINVWESGVEAQIDAELGEAQITFFDIAFAKHRLWYEAGKSYEFMLSGIAYGARPAETMKMKVNRNPDEIAWQRALAEKRGEAADEMPSIINLRGMALLMPIDDCDADDYQFRGPVKSVKDVDIDMLGQRGWFVKVTVMRFGDDDLDLDMLITKRAWQGATPPQVGQDIEGMLWLQGYLWSIYNS